MPILLPHLRTEDSLVAENLRVIPLGGLGEVGKNMLSIEYGRDILVIDAGMMFPESDMLGIDYIIPDWQYLRGKTDRIRGVVITHGHEDHIGALPHFLSDFDVPVYATRLTRGLIEVKLRQRHLLDKARITTYAENDVLQIGPFGIEPFHVCHSIPDSVGLAISTPGGLIIHSGDFKFDHTPVDGRPPDYARLSEFSGRGVLALLSDSTNADTPGHTPSESVLNDAFHQVMRRAPGRVIVATFASLISRIQQVIGVAVAHGRKVAIAGKTMAANAKMARELGYLKVPDGSLVTLDEVRKLPAEQTVIMATGTQGEPTAALSRLSLGRHPSLQIKTGDTVVLSSHTIPGNEEHIHRVINRLFQKGADVYYDGPSLVHVSGHASQEEQKLLINILRPKFFVPVHGELRHLKQHGKIAAELGLPPERIAVIENGYTLTLGDNLIIGERVPGRYVFVDGSQVGEIGPAVMCERDALGQSGFVVAVVPYRAELGQLVGEPQVVTRGFVAAPGAERLLSEAHSITESAASVDPGTSASEVEGRVSEALSRYFYKHTRRQPVVIAVALRE
jgi:ribonuclease J